jgi:hypothetical protein
MNTSQMFSHFQRGITFIGAVNSPFDIPESSAKEMPSPTMLPLPPDASLLMAVNEMSCRRNRKSRFLASLGMTSWDATCAEIDNTVPDRFTSP